MLATQPTGDEPRADEVAALRREIGALEKAVAALTRQKADLEEELEATLAAAAFDQTLLQEYIAEMRTQNARQLAQARRDLAAAVINDAAELQTTLDDLERTLHASNAEAG